MSNKWIVVAIVASVFLFLVWASKPDSTPTPSPVPEKKSEMTVFEDAYMSECFDPETGGAYAYCKCTYDYLDDRLTDKGLIDMAAEYDRTEESPKIMNDAISSCLYLLK